MATSMARVQARRRCRCLHLGVCAPDARHRIHADACCRAVRPPRRRAIARRAVLRPRPRGAARGARRHGAAPHNGAASSAPLQRPLCRRPRRDVRRKCRAPHGKRRAEPPRSSGALRSAAKAHKMQRTRAAPDPLPRFRSRRSLRARPAAAQRASLPELLFQLAEVGDVDAPVGAIAGATPLGSSYTVRPARLVPVSRAACSRRVCGDGRGPGLHLFLQVRLRGAGAPLSRSERAMP